jgi:hypothetical protein
VLFHLPTLPELVLGLCVLPFYLSLIFGFSLINAPFIESTETPLVTHFLIKKSFFFLMRQ